jgi:hypothetical protein
VSTKQLIGTIEKVEQHEPDPKTPEADDPWKTVSSQFESLGGHLRETYQRVADGTGPSDDEVKGAFSTLAGAWNQVAGTFAEAFQDPGTLERLKTTASSLAAALGTTLSQLGQEITKIDRDEEE